MAAPPARIRRAAVPLVRQRWTKEARRGSRGCASDAMAEWAREHLGLITDARFDRQRDATWLPLSSRLHGPACMHARYFCPVPSDLSHGQAALTWTGSVSAATSCAVAGARLPVNVSHFAAGWPNAV